MEIAGDVEPSHLSRSVHQSTIVSQNKRHVSTGRIRFAQVQDSGMVQNGLIGALALPEAVDAAQQTYANQFWQEFGAGFGITDPTTELVLLSRTVDTIGETHLRYQQYYEQVPVFGAQLALHYDADNRIKVVNGLFVPELSLDESPSIDAATAATIALTEVARNPLGDLLATPADLHTHESELYVYRTNVARGETGVNYLAYVVEVVAEPFVREQVFVNAHKGTIIERIDMLDRVLNRRIYNGQYRFQSIIWQEGNSLPYSGTGSADVNNQIEFSEDIYNLIWTLSGGTFDSWDGAGASMESIYNANIGCPNATWDGGTANFCPGVTSDDIVAHEWAHAYTEGTHDLIYAWQSGALNESYSDIWGETADLLNGAGTDDAIGVQRVDGVCTANDSLTRWLVGEDSTAFGSAIRDMWQPSCFGHPDSVSDNFYFCGTGDSGGVHINSGVPNHAYALLVDGGTFNGQTVNGIGLTKAAHIYWRGQTVYQTLTSNFVDHADALAQSCQDLIGVSISELSTDSQTIVASAEQIDAADCTAVDAAIAAVELLSPTACNYTPNLAPNPPALCQAPDTYAQIFGIDWESGPGAWSIGTYGITGPGTFDTPNWDLNANLPDARVGQAAYVPNDSDFGNCGNDDETGVLYLQSPEILIPSDVGAIGFAFDHWFATEAIDGQGIDGGNIKVSVNGGDWTLVPSSAFVFNGYNTTLIETYGGSQITTPLAGEDAFSGTDDGSVGGSWGQSQIDLSAFAAAGDIVQLRFEMGQDGCTGVQGWYVDEVDLYQCVAPPTATPTNTPVPPTPTETSTPLPTDTPIPPTETPIPTDTPIPPTDTVVPTTTPIPTDTPIPPTETPIPTDTPIPPTDTVVPTATPIPPTDTAVPTATPIPPTDTAVPTATLIPPTDTAVPTATLIPPTDTVVPTATPIPPTDTVVPTATPISPTDTAVPTATPIPPTDTAVPTATPIPPTDTAVPTATPIPPTDTAVPTATPIPLTVTPVLPTATQTAVLLTATATATSSIEADSTGAILTGATAESLPESTVTPESLTPTKTPAPAISTVTATPVITTPVITTPTPAMVLTLTPVFTATTTIAPIASPMPSSTPIAELIRLTVRDGRTTSSNTVNSVISWLFVKDERTSGFEVYRSISPEFNSTDVILIESISEIVAGVNLYNVADDERLSIGTYYYWVSQLTSGGPILYGPLELERSRAYELFLPLIDE